MQVRSAVPARHHHRSEWRMPIVLGLLFGLWAAGIDRSNGASAVVAVLCQVVHRERGKLTREVRAGAYGALFGAAMGYLLSLSGSTLLKSSLWGLMFAAIMAGASYYRFSTRES